MSSKIEADTIQIENLQDKLDELKKVCQHGLDLEEAIEELRPRDNNKAGITINGIFVLIDYDKVKTLLKSELEDTTKKANELKEQFKENMNL